MLRSSYPINPCLRPCFRRVPAAAILNFIRGDVWPVSFAGEGFTFSADANVECTQSTFGQSTSGLSIDLSVLHHQDHATQSCDVPRRISLDRDKIGEQPLLDHAKAIIQSKYLGGD